MSNGEIVCANGGELVVRVVVPTLEVMLEAVAVDVHLARRQVLVCREARVDLPGLAQQLQDPVLVLDRRTGRE